MAGSLDNTGRIDRLEQKVNGLDATDQLHEERIGTARGIAEDAQDEASDAAGKVAKVNERLAAIQEKLDHIERKQEKADRNSEEIVELKAKLDALQKERDVVNPTTMKSNLDLLWKEREAAISRRWQLIISIAAGIVVGVAVGVILTFFNLKK